MGLNRNQMKYTALIAMFIDHIAMFFINSTTLPSIALYALMRTVGRLTAPIMCFFLAEGFMYTKSKLKYGKSLPHLQLSHKYHIHSRKQGNFSLLISI